MSIAEAPTISVLIVVKDEPEIERTLEILKVQCDEVKAECIVVDASEHRLDSISAKHPWVHWIDYKQPAGQRFTIPQQRNIAVAKSNGEILVFCDAGGEPCQGWLKALIAPILEGRAKITGGPITIISKSSPDYEYNNQIYGSEIQVPTTANMAFTRAGFDLAGGFDETLEAGEDAAFVWILDRNKIVQFAIPQANMGLDNGTSHREMKRAWRYGKSMSTLLYKFPERRKKTRNNNFHLRFYSIILMMILGSLGFLLIDVNKSKIIIMLITIIYSSLAVKNRKSRRPWFGLLLKTIKAFAMSYETLRRKIFHRTEYGVMSYPVNNSRYSYELEKALTQSGFKLHDFYQLTRSATTNMLLLPLTPLLMRIHGYGVLHIHWLFQFKLHWQVSRKWRYVMRHWFTFWIFATKIFGIKIVWTFHDPLPHEQIFDNDLLAADFLIKNCNSLTVLNKQSMENLQMKDYKTKKILIPEGPAVMSTTIGKIEFISRLQVAPTKQLIVLVGYLSPYKGVTSLLAGSFSLPSTFAIRIAGKASEQYQKELALTLSELKSHKIDIDISFGRLTDDEYGAYLNSADFFCVPFKQINNSESINSALCAGVPVIVPNIDSLGWIPSGARLDIPYDSEGNFDFKELFKSLERLTLPDYESMKKSALHWASTLSWKDVAEKHINVYSELNGKNE